MLHTKTVEPNTLSILKRLQSLPELDEFYLVGGTALALKYGHRLSVDLDLFGENFEKEAIISAIEKEFGTSFSYEQTPSEWPIFCFVEGVKVDIVKYTHPMIAPVEEIESIKMATSEDIAAMKINAIFGRATKKDFWDIYELLHHFELEKITDYHLTKYPKQMLLISIPQALSYFEEAEESQDPVSLKNQTWERGKKLIKERVRDYLK